MWSLLGGILAMFFIERFLCYHHHDVPPDEHEHSARGDIHAGDDHEHHHVHDLSWSGAALGLSLHSILNGVALAASVQHDHNSIGLVGLGTFLVIFLHKPFDAMTIGMLMARGGWSLGWRHAVNGLFSLAIPLGVIIFYFGLLRSDGTSSGMIAAYALSFSAGTFLCIACSDLLPELQFHQHDRVKLSFALLLGLGVAVVVTKLESITQGPHTHPNPTAAAGLTRPQAAQFRPSLKPSPAATAASLECRLLAGIA
jgi:zinc and cadmium transporter